MMVKDYKILLVLGNTIGDAVCFTSAINELKKINPNFMLDVLTPSSQVALMYSVNPAIRAVILRPSKEKILEMRDAYDFAIAFPMLQECFYNLKKLGLKTFHAECYTKPHAECVLDMVRFLFPEAKPLNVDRYYLYPQLEHEKEIDALFQKNREKLSENSILIGCHLGYSGLAVNKKSWFKRVIKKKYGSRVWPLFNYAKLLERLLEKNSAVRMVIIGTASEKKLIKKFFKKYSYAIIDACDQTSLLGLAVLMKRLRCYVGGDSGPLHVASSANIPLLALMTHQTANFGKPYPLAPFKHMIVKDKMSDISVDEVYDKIIEMGIVD